MSLVVDAHQHFWTYGTYQTSWMDVPPYTGNPAFQTLRRSFQPDDLMPELTAAGAHCTVTIEAADNLAENEALLANSHSSMIGSQASSVGRRSRIRARLNEHSMYVRTSRLWSASAI